MHEDLLRSSRIRRQKVSQDEIRRALDRAKRDLKVARKIMSEDWDWGFAVTYNAILQASRSFMFSKGPHRSQASPRGEGRSTIGTRSAGRPPLE